MTIANPARQATATPARGTPLRRAGMLAMGLLLVGALGACTTVEGTNALTDVGTFEREVMTSTAQGLGLVPQGEEKADPQPRAPLALPRNAQTLPQPRQTAENLPENRDAAEINVAGLSEQDIARLRNARVVDLRSTSGRPLTDEEARALTARMSAAGMNVSATGERPLYLPPERYFTAVGGRNMVCQTAQGDLVPLADERCPAEIREAVRSAGPGIAGERGNLSTGDLVGSGMDN